MWIAPNNRCLSNWATVVCQKEELSTHWTSLYLSYSHLHLLRLVLLERACDRPRDLAVVEIRDCYADWVASGPGSCPDILLGRSGLRLTLVTQRSNVCVQRGAA